MDGDKVTYFAQTDTRGKRVPFGIKRKDRSRHTYVIGKTGMGKSTVLENMAIQDIQNGEGLAFIDPHGKTAELLLEYVPKERINDVLYFAPFDMEYPISFNVMEDVGIDKRHLVANGLMSTFEKIWVDAWSARMAYILNNTILALLEYPGATLLSVNRMLSDKAYRKLVVDNVTDPSVKSFWVDEFGKYTERFAQEATPAIQNKVGQFTSNPLIRNLIGQSKSSFDLRKMMDEKKIVIINLSKGRVGEGNANLIGSMLITKIYLAAMSRADLSDGEVKKLPDFYLYVDEFQSFANKSFADILSEARKYKLSLTIAHQYIEQMEEEVRAAVFGNVGTMIAFRVGAYDAEVLEKEFSPQFTAADIVNLGVFQIYLKLMINGVSSVPFSATTLPPIPLPSEIYNKEVVAASRAAYARPRAVVESEIRDWHASGRVEEKAGPRSNMPRRADESPAPREQQQSRSFNNHQNTQRPAGAMGSAASAGGAHRFERSDRPRNDRPQVSAVPQAPVSAPVEPPAPPRPAPLSLSALKPRPSASASDAGIVATHTKKPTPQNLSALRDALASAIRSQPAVATPPPPPSSPPRPAPAPETPQTPPPPRLDQQRMPPGKVEEVKEEGTVEVSQETLRKVLKGDKIE
jgi:Type IV secretion-system coupling protein DNA-binding domain